MPFMKTALRTLVFAGSYLAGFSMPAPADWSATGNPLALLSSGSQGSAAIASDGAGGAIVVWSDWRNYNPDDPRGDLYAQRVTSAGEIAPGWPAEGVPICVAPSSQHTYRIIADGSGGAYIAWIDFRDAPATGNLHIYLQRIRSDGTLASGWVENGISITRMPGYSGGPVLAPDGAGGVFVVWNDTRRATPPGADDQIDIYAQRITSEGRVAPGWPTDGLVVCTAPGWRSIYNALSDGDGGLYLAWGDGRDMLTRRTDIYAIRLTAEGTVAPGWAAGGTPLCTESNFQGIWDYGTALVPDAEGGFYVGWIHGFGEEAYDIYAQRVTSSGQIAQGWPSNGLPVCTAPGLQHFFDMEPDGYGGVLFTWSDYRNYFVSAADLYAQRILPSGAIAPGWARDGNLLSAAPAWQETPSAVATGDGGALVVFETFFEYRAYLQRVTGSGEIAAGWSPNGLALVQGGDEQYGPTAVSDGAGGMIVAWEDSRDGSQPQIYAQWVSGSRPVPTTPRITGTGRSRLVSWRLSEPSPGSAWLVLRARKDGPHEQMARVEAGAGMDLSWTDTSPPAGVLRYRIRRDVDNPQYRTESGDGVWPPAQDGKLTLARGSRPGELELQGAAGPIQLKVYDVQGRLVYERDEAAGGQELVRLELDSGLRQAGAGVYFATVRDAAGRTTPPVKLVLVK
jgi:hypothetical protein